MLTKLEQAQERWGGSHKLIDNWLEARKELLVHYCRQAGFPPSEKRRKDSLPSQDEILQFCQILVDYVSIGHFEVYDRVIEECTENGSDSHLLSQELYPTINKSTDLALRFNDHYAENVTEDLMESFANDLSELGQMLAERFSQEDELLQILHETHSEIAIAS